MLCRTFKRMSGQSAIEYILLVTAVVLIILSFTLNKNGSFAKAVNNTLQVPAAMINDSSQGIQFHQE